MKDELRAVLLAGPKAARVNLAREYLQARILAALQRAGAMVPLAFHGGTALRFLYRLPRYSEGLDFALEGDPVDYDLARYTGHILAELRAETYTAEARLRAGLGTVVHTAFVRFPGLLHELALSPHPRQVFSVKIEVDTRPPAGAVSATTLLRSRDVVLNLHHHDRSSLLAGKLHAVLQRPHAKGRDLFDLFWYLSDHSWPAPNLGLLANALTQTRYDGPPVDSHHWRVILARRIEAIDEHAVLRDLSPLIEQGAAAAFSMSRLLELLR